MSTVEKSQNASVLSIEEEEVVVVVVMEEEEEGGRGTKTVLTPLVGCQTPGMLWCQDVRSLLSLLSESHQKLKDRRDSSCDDDGEPG